jgi:Arc/MetJ family transcription regulator
MTYAVYMAKTLVDLDEVALAAAQQELGTTTKKDTINEALRIIANRQQHAQALLDNDNPYARFGVGADITDPEVMRAARR